MIISIDFETRSFADLKKVGVHRYAMDTTTEILCMAYAIGDKEPEIWLQGQPFPKELRDIIEITEFPFAAWNAAFEISIWKHVGVDRLGWPEVDMNRWIDSMGDAAMCSLPLGLDDCALQLRCINRKDPKGKNLITKLCKPFKGAFRTYEKFTQDYHDLYDYCMQDVRVERDVRKRIPQHVSGNEMYIQRLTWLANKEGMPIDVDDVKAINARIEDYIKILDKKITGVTSGEITGANKREAILHSLDINRAAVEPWLLDRERRKEAGEKVGASYISKVPSAVVTCVDKDTLPKVLKRDDLTEYDRSVLEIYGERNHAAIAKYKRMLLQVCDDNTIKDNLQYHGAGTGRDAGRGFQMQNLPRAHSKEPDVLLEYFYRYKVEILDLLFSPLEEATKLVRHVIRAHPGKKLLVDDYSQIEARGTAWTAKEEDILENFRRGINPYKALASRMYGVPIDEIEKGSEQYQYGKMGELACIAEGQLVLTDHGLVPIEKVCTCMRVWDGVEWVSHDGVIFKGEREVISYEELLATPEHIVYTEEEQRIEIQEAARSSQRIANTGFGRTAIRLGDGGISGNNSEEWEPYAESEVQRMLKREMDKHDEPAEREDIGLSEMFPTKVSPKLAAEAVFGSKMSMPKQESPELQKLRRERNTVYVRIGDGYGSVYYENDWDAQRERNRQNRQQWSLREGQPAVRYPDSERIKQTWIERLEVPLVPREVPKCQICGQYLKELHSSRDVGRGNSEEVGATKLQAKRKVWDILNAGSRNRFTVEGKLVSNCGYMGSHKALTDFAEGYGLTIPRKEAVRIVKMFRAARPKLVAAWDAFGYASRLAVCNPGEGYQVEDCQKAIFKMYGTYLTMELPSGRKLWYPEAKIEEVEVNYVDGETGEERVFKTEGVTYLKNDGKKSFRVGMHGGKFLQNYVQAICRDLLMSAHIRLYEAGYTVVGRVHDEIICHVPDDTRYNAEEMQKLMCVVPEWAKGFPISSEPEEMERYKK